MNDRRLTVLTLVLALGASGLLLASLRLPLWTMRMEAPQYQGDEALKILVHPDQMRGDLSEIQLLNQYIGVRVPETLPQFAWLPRVLIAAAAAFFISAALPRTIRSLAAGLSMIALAAALGAAALMAQEQMHRIGHERDAKPVLSGVKDFTPPLLGAVQIANFRVVSRLGAGAWIIGGALLLQAAGIYLNRRARKSGGGGHIPGETTAEHFESSAVPARSQQLT